MLSVRLFISIGVSSALILMICDALQVVHGSFFIFRNKSDDITGDGTPLVPLPPREDHVIDVKLTYWERAVYQHIRGLKLSNFAQITRLRQGECSMYYK